ncbi:GntR family transcriptional regulator [Mesorhizobium sp. L-8-10]|uniref:GntR family transcriptional regulator n=1 Tax=Mesorhizobium sp. L-8-10 TaxID=2744523 RepID=UPI001927153E|nr:GntR family transcriptional regulator [Mesorhizobium sp. L-8-10]BCH32549.1 GntR family transcriptional regulator [Mesorhizobium sp. L-8-10]
MKINQSSRLKAQIEEEIATGALRPGERLDEASLAARFGVSRTPIREALQQLSIAGLIEHRRHRGAVVSAPDPKQLLEMFELMAEFEAICARLASRRMLVSDEVQLKKTLESCRLAAESGDTDAYYYENERFHQAIYTASGNTFVAEQAMALHKRLAPFRRLQLRVRNRMQTSFSEHKSIVEALTEGDGDLAASRAYAHVAVQGERFADLIASINRAAARQ